MGRPALGLAGRLVELGLSVETEISGRALTDWYFVLPWGLWWSNVLNLALPCQRLRPDTRPEHKDPVSHIDMLQGLFPPRDSARISGSGLWVQKLPLFGNLPNTTPERLQHFLGVGLLSCTSPIATKKPSQSSCCSFILNSPTEHSFYSWKLPKLYKNASVACYKSLPMCHNHHYHIPWNQAKT